SRPRATRPRNSTPGRAARSSVWRRLPGPRTSRQTEACPSRADMKRWCRPAGTIATIRQMRPLHWPLQGGLKAHCCRHSGKAKVLNGPHRRQFLHLALGAVALPAVSGIARAQAYPTRLVRIVAGFPAGGITDVLARFAAQWLSERLGQPYIVENRA